MEKQPRSKKKYGGGSGRGGFESEFFRVVFWSLGNGRRTTISIKATYAHIHFDGTVAFLSDDDCFSQLTPKEIINIIKRTGQDHFAEGRRSKMAEFKKALGM